MRKEGERAASDQSWERNIDLGGDFMRENWL